MVDAHGDIYSADVVKQAAHDFARFVLSNGGANIQHQVDVDKSTIEFVESFVAPIDMPYENGDVLKGDWVATAKIHNDEVWDMCKSGEFKSFSIGCSSMVEHLSEEDDDS